MEVCANEYRGNNITFCELWIVLCLPFVDPVVSTKILSLEQFSSKLYPLRSIKMFIEEMINLIQSYLDSNRKLNIQTVELLSMDYQLGVVHLLQFDHILIVKLWVVTFPLLVL